MARYRYYGSLIDPPEQARRLREYARLAEVERRQRERAYVRAERQREREVRILRRLLKRQGTKLKRVGHGLAKQLRQYRPAITHYITTQRVARTSRGIPHDVMAAVRLMRDKPTLTRTRAAKEAGISRGRLSRYLRDFPELGEREGRRFRVHNIFDLPAFIPTITVRDGLIGVEIVDPEVSRMLGQYWVQASEEPDHLFMFEGYRFRDNTGKEHILETNADVVRQVMGSLPKDHFQREYRRMRKAA